MTPGGARGPKRGDCPDKKAFVGRICRLNGCKGRVNKKFANFSKKIKKRVDRSANVNIFYILQNAKAILVVTRWFVASRRRAVKPQKI